MEESTIVQCQDRVFKYKNRYVVYAVHARPHTKKISFVFSGVDSTAGTCRMSYFGLGSALSETTVVHIMDNFGTHGCYLLNISGDVQIRNAVIQLIRQLQEEFGCSNDQTYFIGTSKGASTAINYSLFVGGGHVICGEPQILLGDFIYNSHWQELEQWRAMAYAMTGRVDPDDREHLNDLIKNIVSQYGSRYRGEMTIHYGDKTGYWEHHVSHFVEWSKEYGFDTRVKTFGHDFHRHDDVIPVFYQAVYEILTKPLKVAIIGSCVTRDAFKDIKNIEILYVARTSFISLASKPFDISEDEIPIEGNFERRMVLWDLNKQFLTKLSEFKPDVIILDFIDERFDLIEYENGFYVRSNYLVNSGILDRMPDYKIIRRQNCDELWKNACRILARELLSVTKNIVLHQSHWATSYRHPDSNEIIDFTPEEAKIAIINNRILDTYYQILQEEIPSLTCLKYESGLLYSDYAHQWGKDYFHFGNEYYHDIATKLRGIFDDFRIQKV